MAEAYDFDPLESDEEVEVDQEELRLIDERCREIDEGHVELIDEEEVERITEGWLSEFATPPLR